MLSYAAPQVRKDSVCMGLSAKGDGSRAALREGRGGLEAGRSRDSRNVLSLASL